MSLSVFLRSGFSAAALLVITSITPLPAQEAKVLATVDGHVITSEDVEFARKTLGDALSQVAPDQQQDFIVKILLESHPLADAARKEGIADTEEYKRQIAWLEVQALRERVHRRRSQVDTGRTTTDRQPDSEDR